MTAALATLAFLSTLWLLTVVGALIFEHSGAKILAALNGRSMDPALHSAPVRLRHRERERERTAYRAMPRLRAAA